MDARFRVQFVASPAFMERLTRVRAIASHRLPANASLEQVFVLALEYFIEREDPAKRHERRERRAEKRGEKESHTVNLRVERESANERDSHSERSENRVAAPRNTRQSSVWDVVPR
jgi:hypothetical protein